MNTQELEQVILAVTQIILLLNQLFMTKKMKEGMSKLGRNKDAFNDFQESILKLNNQLELLEDRLCDLTDYLINLGLSK